MSTTYSSIIDLLSGVFNELNLNIEYVSEIKDVDVKRQGIFGVFTMSGVEPVLYWHNWANNYIFKLRLYGLTGQSTTFMAYDEAIQIDTMYKVIGTKLTTGAVPVGYDTKNDWRIMIRERGANIIDYDISVLVLYYNSNEM